jgi:integrase
LLIANGRHMEEVKAHLGHSSIRVTSDRYGHLFPQACQQLADDLDETYRRAASAGGAVVRPLHARRHS